MSIDSHEKLSAPGIRTFFRIAERWELSADEQMTLLGINSHSTLSKWKKNSDVATLSRDTLERISYILGIFKALQILLPKQTAADEWVRRPNEASPFAGRSALECMLSGQLSDLAVVRQYLDAQVNS